MAAAAKPILDAFTWEYNHTTLYSWWISLCRNCELTSPYDGGGNDELHCLLYRHNQQSWINYWLDIDLYICMTESVTLSMYNRGSMVACLVVQLFSSALPQGSSSGAFLYWFLSYWYWLAQLANIQWEIFETLSHSIISSKLKLSLTIKAAVITDIVRALLT